MKTLAIVQARMGSTRLPGKVLLELAGRSVLARVVRRASRAKQVNQLIVASTTEPLDDRVAEECHALGVPCFRGHATDVLDRFHRAALAYEADIVVRLTADCPLIDPEVIDRTVAEFFAGSFDYASNSLVRTYPRGLDTEVLTRTVLETAWQEARLPYERTHVTPFFYQHPERFRLLSVECEQNCGHLRWTLDTPEDLTLLQTIYSRLGGNDSFRWTEVLDLFQREPGLAEINAQVQQKVLEEG
jgi:spore coat polysaccharide biosynthesis protein SpsF